MREHNLTSGKPLHSLLNSSKDTLDRRQKQLNIIKAAFYNTPATMLMIAQRTGIERANICRHVATLRKAGAIIKLYKGICPITGFQAGFYTTNVKGGQK